MISFVSLKCFLSLNVRNPEDDEDSDGKMLDNYSPNIVFISGNICNDACVIANPKTERVEELNLCLSNQSPSIT